MYIIYLKLLFSFLHDKELYNTYKGHIDVEDFKELGFIELSRILYCLESYHAGQLVGPSPLWSFTAHFYGEYSGLKKADRDLYERIFNEWSAYDPEICKAEVLPHLTSLAIAREIKVLLDKCGVYLAGADAKPIREHVGGLLEDLESTTTTLRAHATSLNTAPGGSLQQPGTESLFVPTDVNELVTQVYFNTANSLQWRLNAMQVSVGPISKGDFMFLFARPEVGKTTFLASEVTNFLSQTDKPLLWINNEQPGSVVMLRCVQALLNVTMEEILNDPINISEKFRRMGGDRLRIFDEATANKQDIEHHCRNQTPGVIVIDQIDKLYGFKMQERNDLYLKKIYQWARELAKQYCPVIGVCQAGGTAEGKKYLTMNDIDSSHTAKQGEADVILGIGADDSYEEMRYLSICKNKLLSGRKGVKEMYRHAQLTCKIDVTRARFLDNTKW